MIDYVSEWLCHVKDTHALGGRNVPFQPLVYHLLAEKTAKKRLKPPKANSQFFAKYSHFRFLLKMAERLLLNSNPLCSTSAERAHSVSRFSLSGRKFFSASHSKSKPFRIRRAFALRTSFQPIVRTVLSSSCSSSSSFEHVVSSSALLFCSIAASFVKRRAFVIASQLRAHAS